MNWVNKPGNLAVGTLEALEHAQIIGEEPTYHDGSWLGMDSTQDIVLSGKRTNAILHLKDRRHRYEPILGLYTHGKPAPKNQGCLDEVLTHALSYLRTSAPARILILGLRVPPTTGDDPRLEVLLAELKRFGERVVYVSPSDTDCAEAEKFGFATKAITFEQLLADGCLTRN